jgi:hypothetical protein
LTLVALILPAAASGQATRTWVSGVGDDANPCSRTAPCKTFAGAISKTATTGEINCLDPGGFGAVTITKAIAIKCHNTLGGILNAGTNGVIVNAPAGAKVTLRGLDINGAGTGINGIRYLGGGSLKIYDTEIFGNTSNGIDIQPTTGGISKVLITRSDIHDNGGDGILIATPASGNVVANVSHSNLDDNTCGAVATNRGATGVFATNCGTGSGSLGQATMNLFHNTIHDHRAGTGTGVFSSGAIMRIGDNAISGNSVGIDAINTSGGIFGVFSFGNNYIVSNGNNGTPTGAVLPTS